MPQSLRPLLLPRTGWSNAVVCLAQWRDSSSKGSSYDRLSAEAAAILKIDDHLPGLEIDQLARRDDLPGRREADRQQPAGSGADYGGHDQRRGRAGRRHSPAGRALGLAHGGGVA